MIHQPLYKHRTVLVLSALLEVCNGTEEWLVQAGEQLQGIVVAEEHLPCGISARWVVLVAVLSAPVLAVVEQYDAVGSLHGWRSAFGQPAVKIPFARACQILECAVGLRDDRPVDEVVRCGSTHPFFAPVHQILLFAVYLHLGSLQPAVAHLGHYGTRFACEVGEESVERQAESRSVVRPVS